MHQSDTVMEKLAELTRGEHEKLQSCDFSKALVAGHCPLDGYLGFLRALAVVHATLEAQLEQSPSPLLGQVWRAEMRKFPLLQRDLDSFSAHRRADLPLALAAAGRMSDRILDRASQEGVSLLGYLYVLEGSTLGAPTLRRAVAQAFGLEGGLGLDYLSNYGRDGKEHWNQFGQRMEGALVDGADQAQVFQAAQEAYQGVLEILQALFPIPVGLQGPAVASSLNPEAGTHPIASDPREIQAAIRAGERCLQRFPYFEARYGERGRRFASSDGAWLVTLCALPLAQTHQQVLWLGRLLALRGMPRLTLEVHLELLFEELCQAVPERASQYVGLRTASLELSRIRRLQIDQAAFEDLCDQFEASLVPYGVPLTNMGPLLVSSVADERAGIQGAVASLQGWLSDPARFSAEWIEAVKEAVARARAAPPAAGEPSSNRVS